VPAGQVTQPVMLDGKAVLLIMRSGQGTPAKAAAAAPTPAPAASDGPSFEAAREQIQEVLYKQKFDKLFQDYMDNLRSKAVVEVKL
jgi:peptidyl-prolyl cis-trans isomerase SurA